MLVVAFRKPFFYSRNYRTIVSRQGSDFMPKGQAVYHHHIPQTYMKPWCFSNNSIWTFTKATKTSKERNIENICGVNHFHSIKAGSIYTNDEALGKIFGFLENYKVLLDGKCLATLEERNEHYIDFDKWEIFYPNGETVRKRAKNSIHQKLSQFADIHIEEKWNTQFESDWGKISQELSEVLTQIYAGKDIALTVDMAEIIMKYFVMFEWRGRFGNPALGNLWDFVFTDVFENGDEIIPQNERTYNYDETISEEMKHAFLLREFDGFFVGQGSMYKAFQIYCEQLTFLFLFSQDKRFITSDNPCFTFVNNEGYKEPTFVVLPNLIISLAKKDPKAPTLYKIANLTDNEVEEYNAAIFMNGDLILSTEKIAFT